MSIPPLPGALEKIAVYETANALHSLAIHLLRRARAADRESGLSPERLSVLSVLTFAGPRTVSALAELEGVSAPAISRIVSGLEKEGLVKRERSTQDARQVRVAITNKGKSLVEAARRRRIERIAEELIRLRPGELGKLREAARVLARLEGEEKGAPRRLRQRKRNAGT
ncbi:MarR family winged helix-turn-helix transcriptional regulator [Amphiplicatus metriothermophilus]|uniref:DNA-binding transcriptional regulator, MarR family n=1 Tax=Amphiplicatus metriothermophilus TaxID=1519374 RepID=A0A239PTZ4_9PROT|nr:MarR family transcriptional regulator [Amphiplicatus metriothermophilus]MBB5519313.1 DNA-binding MarR family transcriptional regulator [Amphiplicatus metriothermophilus]SNT73382.1 DNA-binding transcriptional regulator, MarR family [Amphiplicatus metriothermophilus]